MRCTPIGQEPYARRCVHQEIRLATRHNEVLVAGAGAPGLSKLALLATLGLQLTSAAAAGNTYYVNTTADPGPPGTLSLRQAVALSGLFDAITFAPALVDSTITLAQGSISITHDLTIYGFSDPGMLTISGGAADRIFYLSANLGLRRMTLTQGHAVGCGGAVYAKNSGAFLAETVVSGNEAKFGGGICCVGPGSSISVEKSRISGNSAELGGGLYFGQSDSNRNSVTTSTVSGNTARRSGGGIYVAGIGALYIARSLIAGNSVPAPSQYFYSSQGGGLTIGGVNSLLKIRATTITGNYAYSGGSAIRILDASGDRTELSNVTISANSSSGGGAILSTGGTPSLDSSIVANNSGGDLFGTFVLNFSLLKDLYGAQFTGWQNVLGADPQLGPLADNGGPTRSMLPAAGSPVINQGNWDIGDPSDKLLHYDQRFSEWISFRDIGAVERQYPEDMIFRSSFSAPPP
jgi:predicted outer membrane repeat protein